MTSTYYCLSCGNLTAENNSKICYPWVASEFVGRNFTLDDVNSVVMKRNIPGIIFLGIATVLGLIGNIHVLYVFSRRKYKSNFIQDRIHANYRIFILWLSFLSVIQCSVVSPLLIVYLAYTVTYPSDVLCRIFRFVLYFVPVAMNFTLIAIAVDRYLVICKTFQNKLTSKHSKLMCTATVVASIVFSWPAAIVFGRGKTETGIPGLSGYRCYLADEAITKLQQYYQAFLVLFFFVVMIVLLVLYTKVRKDYTKLLRFRRTSRRYSTTTAESFKQRQAKQEKQRVWIYGSVTFGYVVCALPYHILAILFFARVIVDCDLNLAEAQVFYLFIWSYFLFPVINPIIYGFQDDGFRYSVQAIYKHSRDSFKKYLFRKNSTDENNIPNGITHSKMDRKCSTSGTQVFTECTDDSISPDVKPNGELNRILSTIATMTTDVAAITLREDINKNSVHTQRGS